jgi:hypothetical protein
MSLLNLPDPFELARVSNVGFRPRSTRSRVSVPKVEVAGSIPSSRCPLVSCAARSSRTHSVICVLDHYLGSIHAPIDERSHGFFECFHNLPAVHVPYHLTRPRQVCGAALSRSRPPKERQPSADPVGTSAKFILGAHNEIEEE